MTGPYEWNPMPHALDVRCPECARLAVFEHAEGVPVKVADRAFFDASPLFDLELVEARGHCSHVALFFHGLHGHGTDIIRELPEGYRAADWDHLRVFMRRYGGDRGTIVCPCGLRRRHRLSWPSDAWYQLVYRKHTLWAWNREAALELRDHIQSVHRDLGGRRWRHFLMKVPSVFLTARARAPIGKLMAKWLA